MYKAIEVKSDAIRTLLENLDRKRDYEFKAFDHLKETIPDKITPQNSSNIYIYMTNYTRAHNAYIEALYNACFLLSGMNELQSDEKGYRIREDENGKHHLIEWSD